MKHKVGDKVKVKSLSWYEENKDEDGDVCVPCYFVKSMAIYCGCEMTIRELHFGWYTLFEDSIDSKGDGWSWSDEMFED